MDSQEQVAVAGDDELEEYDYEEEGGEEEALQEDAYFELDSDSECIQDIELGEKLGLNLKPNDASDHAVVKPSETPPQKEPKRSEVPQAPPSGMVSSYLDSTLFNSHLSPVKPRPTDTPVKTRSLIASASPGSPVQEIVPQPQPNLAEPMEAADSRAERLARIALLKFSDRIRNVFCLLLYVP